MFPSFSEQQLTVAIVMLRYPKCADGTPLVWQPERATEPRGTD